MWLIFALVVSWTAFPRTLLPGTGLTLFNGSAPHATLVAVIALFAAV